MARASGTAHGRRTAAGPPEEAGARGCGGRRDLPFHGDVPVPLFVCGFRHGAGIALAAGSGGNGGASA